MVALAVVALASLGCGGAGDSAADVDETRVAREQIGATLEEYLPAMATAYSTGDLEPLRAWAVEKELASLERRLVAMGAEGMSLEPRLIEVEIEDVQLWNRLNAFVSTLETWDLRFLSNGEGALISERLGERQRVKYQLKNENGKWWILYREVAETLE